MIEREDRIEGLLALILLNQIKDQSDQKKAEALNLAGFTAIEIADFLNTSTSVVRQHIYVAKKSRSKPKTKKK